MAATEPGADEAATKAPVNEKPSVKLQERARVRSIHLSESIDRVGTSAVQQLREHSIWEVINDALLSLELRKERIKTVRGSEPLVDRAPHGAASIIGALLAYWRAGFLGLSAFLVVYILLMFTSRRLLPQLVKLAGVQDEEPPEHISKFFFTEESLVDDSIVTKWSRGTSRKFLLAVLVTVLLLALLSTDVVLLISGARTDPAKTILHLANGGV